MIIIGILMALILVVGIYLLIKDEFDGLGFGLTLVSSIFLAIYLIIWPMSYYGYMSNIQEYNAVKNTVQDARENGDSEVERAALTTKIIEVNQSLASAKYWNATIFDYAIPDEYANLDQLK